MAELIVGERTRLALPSDNALVGRHSDDGSFTPDIDLAVVEGGRTVSRRHARIRRENGQWYLVVEAGTTNRTVVAGRELTADEQVPLNDGDAICLGKVELVFRKGDERAAAPDATIIRAVGATAELRADGQVFPLNAPEGRLLTLGRHSDDQSYRPDVDLGDLPNGRTVSRRHGELSNRDGQWHLRVEAEVTNPTVLDGKQLERGQDVALVDGSQLQLGRLVVTFHQIAQVSGATDELIELILDPTQAEVAAGGEVPMTVTVINHTGHVDWFKVELEGLPSDWYKILLPDGSVGAPALVRLFHTPAHATPSSDSIAKLKIVFSPPRHFQARAGVHPLVVSATTQGEPQQRRARTSQLTIAPFQTLSLDLDPLEIHQPKGSYHVAVQNLGNETVAVALTVDGNGLVSEWDRKQISGGVTLANGAKDDASLRVRVKRRHWLGPDRPYPLSVKAVVPGAEQTRAVTLICPPRIPIWIQTAYRKISSALSPVVMLGVFLGLLLALWLLVLRPPQITSFEVQPSSIVAGSSVVLSYTVDNRAVRVTIDPQMTNAKLPVPSGKLTVAPTTSTKYTLSTYNWLGLIPNSESQVVEVRPAPPQPQILSFAANPDHINKEGDPVTLSWQTSAVSKVTITPANEATDLKPSGQVLVHPQSNHEIYELSAVGSDPNKPITSTVEILVNAPQILSFTATPETVDQGGEVRLRWTAQNFSKLVIQADKGDVVPGQQQLEVPSGVTEEAVRPLADTQYTLTATNAGGTDRKIVKVSVTPMHIVFFKAEPASIAKGDRSNLSWNVVGASSLSIQPGGAAAPGETTRVVQPDTTTEYTLTATGFDGKQIQQKVMVTVGLGPVKVDFFTAAPATIAKGDKATLTYSVQNAKHLTIMGSDNKRVVDMPVTAPSLQGSVTVSPDQTTTYTLTVVNDSGQTAQPAVVTVAPPTPTVVPSPAAPAVGAGAGSGGGTKTPTPKP
ncbi:MAG TPA: FHA domain-containing protein [Chloroflexota bacterium]|nr:FHA domain-containing protein [Chloroflexota bacterium]